MPLCLCVSVQQRVRRGAVFVSADAVEEGETDIDSLADESLFRY